MGIKEVSEKIELVLDQSGKKLTHLKNRPVVAGAEESARGIWSALHVQRKGN
jgi:large subunit ribosomal protein L43